MKIFVVNPNSTARIRAPANAVPARGTEIIAVNPSKGPASFEACSVSGFLEDIVRGEDAGRDGHMIKSMPRPFERNSPREAASAIG
jgi:allantoin racemase